MPISYREKFETDNYNLRSAISKARRHEKADGRAQPETAVPPGVERRSRSFCLSIANTAFYTGGVFLSGNKKKEEEPCLAKNFLNQITLLTLK